MFSILLVSSMFGAVGGINVGKISWDQSDHAFVNLFQAHGGLHNWTGCESASEFLADPVDRDICLGGARQSQPLTLTDLGYPNQLEEGQVGRAFIRIAGREFPTTIRAEWAGSPINFRAPNAEVVNQGVINQGGDPELNFLDIQVNRPTTLSVNLLKTGVSQLDIRYADEEPPQGLYRESFLKSIEPFQVLRAMDWLQTNNSDLSRWDDRQRRDHGWGTGGKGVPYEALIELSNRTGKDLWLNIPHLALADASDPSQVAQLDDTLFPRQLAKLIKGKLDPGRKVWIEYSNETWNGTFQQSGEMPGAKNHLNKLQAYGALSQIVFDEFESILGQDRVETVLSGQGVNLGVIAGALEQARSPDKIAIGAYFGIDRADGDRPNQNSVMDRIYADFKAGKPDTDEDVFAALRASLNARKAAWKGHADKAKEIGAELVAYEGGQSLVTNDPTQKADAEFTSWLESLQYDDRMGNLYEELFSEWDALGGGTFVNYTLSDTWGPAGSWGLRENYSTKTTKWDAVLTHLGETATTGLPRDHGRWTFTAKYLPAGDANRDQQFDSGDIVLVFQAGEYEDEISFNSTWETGDWNGDGEFDSSDIVIAFQPGYYEQRPPTAASPIPEPRSVVLMFAGLMVLAVRSRCL